MQVQPGPDDPDFALCKVTLTTRFSADAYGGGGNTDVFISASYTLGGTNVPIVSYSNSGRVFHVSGAGDPIVTDLYLPMDSTFSLSITASSSSMVDTSRKPLESQIGDAGILIESAVQVITIEPTAMSFTSDGGVDYGYEINGGDLPQATTIALYWASGTTPDTEIGGPIARKTTETAAGRYPLHAFSDALSGRPLDATYLLTVVDPANSLLPADPSKVESLALYPPALPSSLSSVSGRGAFGGTATLTATLSSGASPLNSEEVSFALVINGVATPLGKATTDAQGVATLPDVSIAGASLGTDAGAIQATFLGDGTFAGTTASGTLTVGPRDVSRQVNLASSGLVYNRATHLFGGTMTLTNAGTTALTSLFEVVLTGLPAGVTVANASGYTADGEPYLLVGLPGGTLAPGQSVTFAVQFSNPGKKLLHYGATILNV
ncbi:hypothetical protein [Aquisphaera insulae]|uniref:hypothetical protein n=1 Tax=Aquisphaera insulae TaxID=2712864 RepID=UPI0013EC1A43|nr:hypothetical protein [Aquisphaera insulae]